MIQKELSRYDTLFEDFLVNIALTHTQAQLIDDVLHEAISLFLFKYEDLGIYTQGSYATGTIVKPLTSKQSKNGVAGEYDVDIVLEKENWNSPTASLMDVRNILKDEYLDKVDEKKNRESCERVYHSKDSNTNVQFHADYVPIKSQFNGAFRYVAHRSDDAWVKSDTKKLKEWFLDYSSDKPFIQALIVILKRIRDYAGLTNKLPSICLMAITCSDYRQSESYVKDLIDAICKVVDTFNAPYEQMYIKMPTIDENLVERVNADDCKEIKKVFQDCLFMLKNEFLEKETPDLNAVRECLSSDFPGNLSDYPECLESLRCRGWGIELDGSLTLKDIIEKNDNPASKRSKTWYRYFKKGLKLEFIASEYDKSLYGIRWQVLNAEGSKKRRGNLFKAKGKDGYEGSNSNEFINYETETFDGVHWIKYYIYNKSNHKVVEIGKKFHVEVSL